MADLHNPKVQKILQSKQFAHLATIRPDGSPQSSPMWFVWDGEKYRNIRRDPRIAVSITDVNDPYIYAEFRGVVERIEEDPSGAFYETLAKRYGAPWGYPGDPRVILYMKIEHIAGQNL